MFLHTVLSKGEQLPLPWNMFGWSYLIDMYSNADSLFDNIKSMLPVLLPIAVGFIGIRKALSFLFRTLHKA